MYIYKTIEPKDIENRIEDKKRLAKRDGHEDAYWFSLMDSLCEDLVHSVKSNPVEVTNVGDLATKEYVNDKIKEAVGFYHGGF